VTRVLPNTVTQCIAVFFFFFLHHGDSLCVFRFERKDGDLLI
jgi:hypothetical protein